MFIRFVVNSSGQQSVRHHNKPCQSTGQGGSEPLPQPTHYSSIPLKNVIKLGILPQPKPKFKKDVTWLGLNSTWLACRWLWPGGWRNATLCCCELYPRHCPTTAPKTHSHPALQADQLTVGGILIPWRPAGCMQTSSSSSYTCPSCFSAQARLTQVRQAVCGRRPHL